MLPRPIARAAGIALFGFIIGTTHAFAAVGEPAPAEKAVPADKAAPAAAPADKAVPAEKAPAKVAPADAKPTADNDAATAECGKALDKLAAGDATALDSLDERRRESLMGHKAASRTITCLAVAEKNEKFCDLLPKEQREGCAHQYKMLGSLKGVSKDELKARVIFEACSQGGNVPHCETIRDAILSHDAGKCNSLPEAKPFCAALATSDASKCKALTDKEMQATCAAYASNDPARCPKDSGDCTSIVKSFRIAAEKGLAGLGDIDPTAVAAVEGRKACTATAADLKKGCGAH